jgi:hypothetical protein
MHADRRRVSPCGYFANALHFGRYGIELTPFDPDFAEALDDAQAFMHAYPNAMKTLAE